MIAQGFAPIALNGFREARRNRVTVVVGVFALILLFASSLVTNVSLLTFDRVLTDVGIGMMSIVLVMLAVFLSSGLLSKEIERRTLFLIVSKPVSRTTFLVARFAGNMLTLLILLIGMAGVFFLEVVLYGTAITGAQVAAVGMLWFELLVISSIGFAMSSFSGQTVSGTVTVALYFAGHLCEDIYRLGEKAESEFLKVVAKGVYYILPNLERVNFRPHATYAILPEAKELLASMAYASAYSVVMLTIACILFQRRDFK